VRGLQENVTNRSPTANPANNEAQKRATTTQQVNQHSRRHLVHAQISQTSDRRLQTSEGDPEKRTPYIINTHNSCAKTSDTNGWEKSAKTEKQKPRPKVALNSLAQSPTLAAGEGALGQLQ